jgi:hypothetical protein
MHYGCTRYNIIIEELTQIELEPWQAAMGFKVIECFGFLRYLSYD